MKKPQSKPESKQKMKVIKGIVRGEKSFKINPKDLERERKANKKTLEEIAKKRSENKEKTLNEKFYEEVKRIGRNTIKSTTFEKSPSNVNIPIELIVDKAKDTIEKIVLEAKLKASDKVRNKFYHKRKEGEPPKPRKTKSPKKEAFIKWVKDYEIDPNLSLDRLILEVEEAYQKGNIKVKIGRGTVYQCLNQIRMKSSKSVQLYFSNSP